MVLSDETYKELMMCLEGAVYCMSHDVMQYTKDFEVRKTKEIIALLEGKETT